MKGDLIYKNTNGIKYRYEIYFEILREGKIGGLYKVGKHLRQLFGNDISSES